MQNVGQVPRIFKTFQNSQSYRPGVKGLYYRGIENGSVQDLRRLTTDRSAGTRPVYPNPTHWELQVCQAHQ